MVTGETGSGKTTQLPKICLAAGRGKRGLIGCCQPRRIAAVSVAKRVSHELCHGYRGLVGYQVRFSRRLSPQTRIKFMTDGILLAEVQSDPMLRDYDTIIVDEAHERSINIDLIAGILKNLLKRRKDLKAVITSATMEVEKFRKFFGYPPLYEIPGRSFPVEIMHELERWYNNPKDVELAEKVSTCCDMIRETDRFSDILVFLPTEKHVLDCCRVMKQRLESECELLPLFGRLPSPRQALIFKPSAKQKIILSTNIAETSITIPGIRYVIDSGLARISLYNVNTHLKALPVSKISKANAMQRAGRAGRIQKGLCIRLYSEDDFAAMEDFLPPEIKRCNLAEVILKILNMGLGPVENFPFVDPPRIVAIKEGLHTLYELGGVDKDGELTPLGLKMARMPIDPRLSKIIFQARKEGCLAEALVIVSALSIQHLWIAHEDADSRTINRAKDLKDESSDFFTLLRIWARLSLLRERGDSRRKIRKFCRDHLLSHERIMEWQNVHNEISSICRELKVIRKSKEKVGDRWDRHEIGTGLRDAVHRSVLAGFLGHVAQKKVKGSGYTGAKGKEIFIFPGSCLFKKGPEWIVSAEQVRTSRNFARTVAPIKPEWIEKLAPHLCRYLYFEPQWDRSRGEAVIKEKVNFYGMTIIPGKKRSLKSIDSALARKIFIEQGLSRCELKFDHKFNEHNKAVMKEFEELARKKRSYGLQPDIEAMLNFFDKGLSMIEKRAGKKICDEHCLRHVLRRKRGLERQLYLNREFLLKKALSDDMEHLYPGFIDVDGQRLPLVYRFDPGEKDDGILVRIPLVLLPYLDGSVFEWLVPGFLPEKIVFLLKNLPKKLRKAVEPVEETAIHLAGKLDFAKGELPRELVRLLQEEYGLDVEETQMADRSLLPPHLVMTFEITGRDGQRVSFGNNLTGFKKVLSAQGRKALETWDAFLAAKNRAEKRLGPHNLSDIPRRVEIGTWGAVDISGFGGIAVKAGHPVLRLFLSKRMAMEESEKGLELMIELLLKREIKHVKNRLHQVFSDAFAPLTHKFPFKVRAINEEIAGLKERILRFLLEAHFPRWTSIPGKTEFDRAVTDLRKSLVPVFNGLIRFLEPAITEYVYLRLHEERIIQAATGSISMSGVLESEARVRTALIDSCFMIKSHEELTMHMPRYLKTLRIRLDRAVSTPQKDVVKQQRFSPVFDVYLKAMETLRTASDQPPDIIETFRMFQIQVFEFMVSVFAPELAVRNRFSQKKLSHLTTICEKAL